MTRTVRISGLCPSVLAVAVVAVVAGSAPPVQATPPGKPGPIAFQRFIDPQDAIRVMVESVGKEVTG